MECKGGRLFERKQFLRSFYDNFEIWGNQNSLTFRSGQAFAGILVPLPYIAQLTVSQTGIRFLDYRNVLVQNFLGFL